MTADTPATVAARLAKRGAKALGERVDIQPAIAGPDEVRPAGRRHRPDPAAGGVRHLFLGEGAPPEMLPAIERHVPARQGLGAPPVAVGTNWNDCAWSAPGSMSSNQERMTNQKTRPDKSWDTPVVPFGVRYVHAFMRFRLLLLASLVLPAQVAPPTTPAGQVLARWLEAFNSGDRARFQDFLQVYNPQRLKNIDEALEFRERTGGFHLISIPKSAEFALEAVVKERDGDNYSALILEVESGAPHRVVKMGLRVTAAPPGAPVVTRLGEQEAAAAWQAELKRRAAEDSFAGAYLWARGGKTIATGALGLADRERKLPNTLETQFRLGSMNKMFTAVAVLQLVEKGRLGLDDVIGKHLREYPNQELAAKVTVRHLLTHTGGTGDIFTPEYERKRLELRTLQDYVALYGARGLRFEPGTRWEYSNYGFILLGVLVERVSGENYYGYVRAHIFRPAGMRVTDSLPESQRVALRAAGYTRQARKWVSNAGSLPWRGTSAGGGYSTAGDLLKFAAALLSHKLLGPALLTEATKVQQEKGGYGFGFGVENEGGVPRFGHGGGAPGMNGVLHVYPASGDVIVVLSNLDPPAATRMAEWLERRMPRR